VKTHALRRSRWTALAGVLLLGCGGGGDGDGGGAAAATGGHVAGGSVTNDVISLPVSIEGTAAQPFVLDTGSVLTRLDPGRYGTLRIEPGLSQVSTLDAGTLHLTNVDVVADSLCGAMMMCRGSEPAGLLGGAVLIGYRVTIDYRAGTVTFGDFTPPTTVGAGVSEPFALEGGGQGLIGDALVTLPSTRIVMDVDVEGRTMRMVLDTGSSSMILRPDVYDSLVGDGRPQSSVELHTVLGTRTAPITRLHSVSVAGLAQGEVEGVRAPLDIEALEREVGHPVEGLLGGAYLSRYLMTIDFPARVLTLRPYATGSVAQVNITVPSY
jgi:hypothetical protein